MLLLLEFNALFLPSSGLHKKVEVILMTVRSSISYKQLVA